MIDDRMTLPLITPAPDTDPSAVTLFASGDDGEPPARLYVRLGNGTVREIAPDPVPPPPAPAQRLTTPGLHGPTVPRALVSGRPEAAHIGAADHDVPIGAVLPVAWRQVLAGAPGWAEVAIVSGPVAIGNQPLVVLAHGDAKDAMGGTGTVAASAVAVAPIQRGTSLWLVVTAWGGTMPTVLASAYPDPIASGAVCVGLPDWKPSQNVGQSAFGWDAQNAPPPICGVVLVP